MRRAVLAHYWAYRVRQTPERKFFERRLLPALAQFGTNVLWVGCAKYTERYYEIIERHGNRCWTIDIEPEAAKWGRTGRHIIGDIRDIRDLLPGITFDLVFCNGVLGFGVNSREAQRQAFEAISSCLRPRGVLLVSWVPDKTADPLLSGVAAPWFEEVTLKDIPARSVIEGKDSRVVYDVLYRV